MACEASERPAVSRCMPMTRPVSSVAWPMTSGFVPVAVIKHPNKSNLEKRFNLVHSSRLQPIIAGKSQRQELEGIGHTTSIARSRDSPGSPAWGMAWPTDKVISPHNQGHLPHTGLWSLSGALRPGSLHCVQVSGDANRRRMTHTSGAP